MTDMRRNLLLISSILVTSACCVFTLLSGILMVLVISEQPPMPITEVERQAQEAQVLTVAANYAETGDLDSAEAQLASLDIPNPSQYIAFMLDRYVQEGRSAEDTDLQNLYTLADSLGANTASAAAMFNNEAEAEIVSVNTVTEQEPVAVVAATETPVPEVAAPTETPLPTSTPTLEPTPEPTVTETPTPEPTPTETPIPLPTATFTPAPPTNTPEPTATPVPEVGFRLVQQEMVRNPTYNECPGAHQIYVTVVDSAGNPLNGVTVTDTGNAVPPQVSGVKGPGKLEYDLWNNGFSLKVIADETGAPTTSQVTDKLSSWDEDIPNEWLVEANYCRDINDCIQRKQSNQLCRGHYAYNVTFQKTY